MVPTMSSCIRRHETSVLESRLCAQTSSKAVLEEAERILNKVYPRLGANRRVAGAPMEVPFVPDGIS